MSSNGIVLARYHNGELALKPDQWIGMLRKADECMLIEDQDKRVEAWGEYLDGIRIPDDVLG